MVNSNLIIAGKYSRTIKFNTFSPVSNITHTSLGEHDIYVLQVNPTNFAYVDSYSAGSTGDDDVYALNAFGTNFFLAGSYQQNFTFPKNLSTTPETINLSGTQTGFVLRANLSGVNSIKPMWGKAITSSTSSSIRALGVSNIVLTIGTWFTGNITSQTSTGNTSFSGNTNSTNNSLLIQYDFTGTHLGNQLFKNAGVSQVFDLLNLGQNRYYAAGYFSGSMYPEINKPSFFIQSALGQNGFLLKYTNCTLPPAPLGIVGSDSICLNSNNYSLSATLAPNSGTETLEWIASQSSGQVVL